MSVVAEEETKRACSRTKLILEGSESTECFGYDFFSTTEDSDATEMTSPCIHDADKQKENPSAHCFNAAGIRCSVLIFKILPNSRVSVQIRSDAVTNRCKNDSAIDV